jgi:hypothetical protein
MGAVSLCKGLELGPSRQISSSSITEGRRNSWLNFFSNSQSCKALMLGQISSDERQAAVYTCKTLMLGQISSDGRQAPVLSIIAKA